jgi:hypothetical protein
MTAKDAVLALHIFEESDGYHFCEKGLGYLDARVQEAAHWALALAKGDA